MNINTPVQAKKKEKIAKKASKKLRVLNDAEDESHREVDFNALINNQSHVMKSRVKARLESLRYDVPDLDQQWNSVTRSVRALLKKITKNEDLNHELVNDMSGWVRVHPALIDALYVPVYTKLVVDAMGIVCTQRAIDKNPNFLCKNLVKVTKRWRKDMEIKYEGGYVFRYPDFSSSAKHIWTGFHPEDFALPLSYEESITNYGQLALQTCFQGLMTVSMNAGKNERVWDCIADIKTLLTSKCEISKLQRSVDFLVCLPLTEYSDNIRLYFRSAIFYLMSVSDSELLEWRDRIDSMFFPRTMPEKPVIPENDLTPYNINTSRMDQINIIFSNLIIRLKRNIDIECSSDLTPTNGKTSSKMNITTGDELKVLIPDSVKELKNSVYTAIFPLEYLTNTNSPYYTNVKILDSFDQNRLDLICSDCCFKLDSDIDTIVSRDVSKSLRELVFDSIMELPKRIVNIFTKSPSYGKTIANNADEKSIVVFSDSLIERSLAYTLFCNDKEVKIMSVKQRERMYLKHIARRDKKIAKRIKDKTPPRKFDYSKQIRDHTPYSIRLYRESNNIIDEFSKNPYGDNTKIHTLIRDFSAFVKEKRLLFNKKFLFEFITDDNYRHYLVPKHRHSKVLKLKKTAWRTSKFTN